MSHDDTASGAGSAEVPEGLVAAVVSLVDTGPVLLGAYTEAELSAVDAFADLLEAHPSDDVLAEAVRSLAARDLLVTRDEPDGPAGRADAVGAELLVRGDLGIAVAFHQRARMALDARATGTEPGEPWRVMLLPQPEPISLMVRVDALGVHELGLFQSDDAIDQLIDWLPDGSPVDPREESDPAAVLAAADRSAMVTVTGYPAPAAPGPAAELVLASTGGDLYAFGRDPDDRSHLVARPPAPVRDSVATLLGL